MIAHGAKTFQNLEDCTCVLSTPAHPTGVCTGTLACPCGSGNLEGYTCLLSTLLFPQENSMPMHSRLPVGIRKLRGLHMFAVDACSSHPHGSTVCQYAQALSPACDQETARVACVCCRRLLSPWGYAHALPPVRGDQERVADQYVRVCTK
eukprot:gnl/TRDRNA2_/TRDRNA2_138880_c0_seq1.p1 gnl/TRDRNA2_/TRDRNA2_138880_c0~~gnl/TRDRNA2_/TRDRNA2_138880_c0_seq1.p1  ORF type:complete len:150 (+),score=0.37 gnl/TRDRNA2_/TRDRNA2_138880_c0_seq1:204-653(+)